MSLYSDLLTLGQLWLFNLLLLPICYITYKHLPLAKLIADKGMQHRFLAATVLLIIVWRININLELGVIIHFLGMTTMTLMFGWPLAIISAFFAQLGFVLTDTDQLNTLALNFIVSGVLPIWFTWRLHLFIESYKPDNPFLYIMVTGFLSCLLSSILVSLMAITLLWVGGKYDFTISVSEYLGYLPLFIFPEAVINGMLISGFCVLHPQWMVSFDDDRYFQTPEEARLSEKSDQSQADTDIHFQENSNQENNDQENSNPKNNDQENNDRYRPPADYYESLDRTDSEPTGDNEKTNTEQKDKD